MTCTSCTGMPTLELFDNSPWLKPEKFTDTPSKACAAKESMTNCLYNTQGEIVCQNNFKLDDKQQPPNKEMAHNTEFGVAKTASPWLSE